jgi:hypothetical protein
MHNFFANHRTIDAIVALWLFSAAVSAMPAPTATTSSGYVWLYSFAHLISANLDKFVASRGLPIPLPPGTIIATSSNTITAVPKAAEETKP